VRPRSAVAWPFGRREDRDCSISRLRCFLGGWQKRLVGLGGPRSNCAAAAPSASTMLYEKRAQASDAASDRSLPAAPPRNISTIAWPLPKSGAEAFRQCSSSVEVLAEHRSAATCRHRRRRHHDAPLSVAPDSASRRGSSTVRARVGGESVWPCGPPLVRGSRSLQKLRCGYALHHLRPQTPRGK
jgi:hypothetical protein